MNKNSGYKHFFVDLDGTLIGRDEQISRPVAEGIAKLKDRLGVSIATGREPSDVLRFARQLGLTMPQVSDNGALILDPTTGEKLWSEPLKPDVAQHVISTLVGLDVEFLATHPGGTVTDHQEIARWDLTRVSALDLEDSKADEVVGLFSRHPDLHVVKVYLPYNGLWAVDFTRDGVNKATAVKWLSSNLGLDAASFIGAGDSYNDLPLLESCGLRIVMGNAPDELKEIADYVAPSVDEDGLAVAIEEFILPRIG
ncbi:MAG: HAD family phosphatase [Chloroflexi bacterium]|nr:HAD family phosphatase [Chloroflexota bacterium]